MGCLLRLYLSGLASGEYGFRRDAGRTSYLTGEGRPGARSRPSVKYCTPTQTGVFSTRQVGRVSMNERIEAQRPAMQGIFTFQLAILEHGRTAES